MLKDINSIKIIINEDEQKNGLILKLSQINIKENPMEDNIMLDKLIKEDNTIICLKSYVTNAKQNIKRYLK